MTAERRISMSTAGLLIAVVVVIFAGAAIMALHPIPSRWDERALLEIGEANYPPASAGITSGLFAMVVRRITPDLEAAHGVMRLLAFAFYCASGALLISQVTPRTGRRLLVFALLLSFKYAFLWLSSEVLAAALLAMLLWAAASNRFWAAMIFAALFATAKPDLLLPGLACAAVLIASAPTPKDRLIAAAVGTALFLALVIPALALHGAESLRERAMVSFGQHYAAMVAEQQGPDALEPWTNWEQYVSRGFGKPMTALEAAVAQPGEYARYVGMSLAWSAKNIFRSGLWLLLPFAAVGLRRATDRRMKWIGAAVLLGLVPLVLTSFIHVRYLARYSMLLLFFAAIGWESMQPRPARLVGVMFGAIALGGSALGVPAFAIGFWFPD